jgi:hypothetical protein
MYDFQKQNSWQVQTSLSFGNNYNFSDEESYGKFINFCSCGSIENKIFRFYEYVAKPKITYCSKCNNDNFLSLDKFDYKKISIEYLKKINFSIITSTTKNGWKACISLDIPVLDQENNKISSECEVLGTLSLDHNGKIKEFKSVIYNNLNKTNDYLDELCQEALAVYIINNPSEEISWIKKQINLYNFLEKDNFKIIIFFLENKHQKEIEFFLIENINDRSNITSNSIADYLKKISNNINVKSVKKAMYSNFLKSIKEKNKYRATADFIITRSFDDVNLISKLINNRHLKAHLFKYISIENAILFFRWLQKYYKAKQIVNSLMNELYFMSEVYTSKWIDIMRMVHSMSYSDGYLFNKYFKKVQFNTDNIHNELIRISHIEQLKSRNIIYKYDKKSLKMETKLSNLEFKLPRKEETLSYWSELLDNCMFGYSDSIIDNSTRIYGVFVDKKLKYAVEIFDNQIIQAYGRFNTIIESKDMNIIEEWGNNFKLYDEYPQLFD